MPTCIDLCWIISITIHSVFAKNVSSQSWDEKKNSLCTDRTQALTVVSVILTVIATLQLHYTTWQMCPNLDLTYVTNQTPCPNGLTHHSGPKSLLAVRICPFCPRPNGRNLTTSVRIWSLTLVPIFRGPGTASSCFFNYRRGSIGYR